MSTTERQKTRGLFNRVGPTQDELISMQPMDNARFGEEQVPAFVRPDNADLTQKASLSEGEPQTIGEFAQLPMPKNEEQAKRLARLTKERGVEGLGQDMYDRNLRILKEWRAANPVQPVFKTPAEEFNENMIATDRVSNVHEETQQKRRGGVGSLSATGVGRDRRAAPKPLKEGSYEAVRDKLEQAGLDTTTGFGDWTEVFGLAKEFNSPRARMTYIDQIARKNLAEEGILTPPGVDVVRYNEDLQELEYLRPDNGKARWTLAEGAFLRPEDVMALADLPEWTAAAGAYAASRVTRHPAVLEFAGDVVGRSVGTTLEALFNFGEVTREEYWNAIKGGAAQSAIDTVTGRIMGRVGQKVFGRGMDPGRNQTAEVLDANIQETAAVMADINRIAGRNIDEGTAGFRVTKGEATDNLRQIQEEKGRQATLSRKNQEAWEEIQLENKKILAEANDNLARGQGVAPARGETIDLVDRANRAINTERAATGKILEPEIVDADITNGTISYSYRFGGDEYLGRKGTNWHGTDDIQMRPGVIVEVDHANQRVQIAELFAGDKFNQGTNALLLDRIMQDYLGKWQGYRLFSDSSMTRNSLRYASKMEDMGFVFSRNPSDIIKAAERNELPENFAVNYQADQGTFRNVETIDDEPLFEIIRVPGQFVTHPNVKAANFDRMALEETLEAKLAVLPAAERAVADAELHMKGVIGWSEQRQVSKYTIENKPNQTLRQHIRRLKNRADQALTNPVASEADRVLSTAIRREVDEDGAEFMGGLNSDYLDVGQLLIARDKLVKIAKDTGDAEVARTVDTIDNLIKKGTIYTEKGNPVAQSTRAAITNAYTSKNTMQGHFDAAQATINANAMFKRSPDGEFVNTGLPAMRSLMGNEARFITHMKPLLDETPELRINAQDALYQIYREDVMGGSGWSRPRHDSFMKKYRRAAQTVFDEDSFNLLEAWPLQKNKDVNWDLLKQRALDKRTKIMNTFDLEPVKLSPNNIVDSLAKMSPIRATRAMRELSMIDEGLYNGVRRSMAEQVRRDLDSRFFSTSEGLNKTGTGKAMDEWYKGKRETLKAVFGDQYVTDMDSIVKAHMIDDRRRRVRGYKPEAQGDIIRITRSLLGPLSRPQRQITAGNYVRQRYLASKILDVYSDPAKLRELKAAKGLSPRSIEGMKVLGRLGIWDAIGIPQKDDGEPLDKKAVEEFYRQAYEDDYRGLEDQAEREAN